MLRLLVPSETFDMDQSTLLLVKQSIVTTIVPIAIKESLEVFGSSEVQEFIRDIPRWTYVPVFLLITLVLWVRSRRAEAQRNFHVATLSTSKKQEIGRIPRFGVVWLVIGIERDLWVRNDDFINSIEVRSTPLCSERCKTELEDRATWIGFHVWKCPRCRKSSWRWKSFFSYADEVSKIARGEIRQQIEQETQG